MRSKRSSLFAVGLLLSAATLMAGAPQDRLLTLVPVDATSVGMVRMDALRTGKLTSRLFNETDKLSMDGEAKDFLIDAGLKLTDDVDAVIFATSPSADPKVPEIVVAATGRFDPARLAAAVAKRGATKKQSAGVTYYIIAKEGDKTGAVAFYDKGLVIAGTESGVVGAINVIRAGGSNFLAASGIGLEYGRIDRNADCWMLMDVPRSARFHHTPKAPGNTHLPSNAVSVAMKHVSTLAIWASDSGDDLSFGATAVTSDSETRELLTDMLRGLTASWRIAAQEKYPELVSVIRGFEIENGKDAVSINGSVPAEFLKNFAKKVEQQASK